LGNGLKTEIDDFNTIGFYIDFNKLLVPTPPIYQYEKDATEKLRRAVASGDREKITALIKSMERNARDPTTSSPKRKFLYGVLAVSAGMLAGGVGVHLAMGGTIGGLSSATVAAAKAFGGKAAAMGGTTKTALVSAGSRAWSRLTHLGGKVRNAAAYIPLVGGLFANPTSPANTKIPNTWARVRHELKYNGNTANPNYIGIPKVTQTLEELFVPGKSHFFLDGRWVTENKLGIRRKKGKFGPQNSK
jgi:hypothetical protein